jgi:hypothetical protein
MYFNLEFCSYQEKCWKYITRKDYTLLSEPTTVVYQKVRNLQNRNEIMLIKQHQGPFLFQK